MSCMGRPRLRLVPQVAQPQPHTRSANRGCHARLAWRVQSNLPLLPSAPTGRDPVGARKSGSDPSEVHTSGGVLWHILEGRSQLSLPPYDPGGARECGVCHRGGCALSPSPASSQRCRDLRVLVEKGEGVGRGQAAGPGHPQEVSLCHFYLNLPVSPLPPTLSPGAPVLDSQEGNVPKHIGVPKMGKYSRRGEGYLRTMGIPCH